MSIVFVLIHINIKQVEAKGPVVVKVQKIISVIAKFRLVKSLLHMTWKLWDHWSRTDLNLKRFYFVHFS